ncbi:MAG: response regulator [Desulfobacterales bacterium]|nr:response regulator [Desulfobacterales bacterium]MCP4158521.1 response regulator [Deltaproteobacteria bacterium]
MKEKWKILIIDDEPINTEILNAILKNDYEVVISNNGKEVIALTEKESPNLILLDVLMPGISGFDICKGLKANPLTEKIPVIFITNLKDAEDESYGLTIGGVDYISKPVSAEILRARVATHIALNNHRINIESKVARRNAELIEIQRATIHMLGEAGHYNDTDTGVHIWRMAAFSGVIAKAAGWHDEKVKMIKLAAPMHDTGKIGISDKILKKTTHLNKEEWNIMQTHTSIGHNILLKSSSELFLTAADIALYHHEKWDGTGYPVGLENEQIPESARIVAIADVFDALTTKRPYKEPWPIDKAFDEIEKMGGNHFEPSLVELFMKNIDAILNVKKMWDNEEQVTKKKFLFPLEN